MKKISGKLLLLVFVVMLSFGMASTAAYADEEKIFLERFDASPVKAITRLTAPEFGKKYYYEYTPTNASANTISVFSNYTQLRVSVCEMVYGEGEVELLNSNNPEYDSVHCTKDLGTFKCKRMEKVPFNFKVGKTYRIYLYLAAPENPTTFLDPSGKSVHWMFYVAEPLYTGFTTNNFMSKAGGYATPGKWMPNQSISVTGLPKNIIKTSNINLVAGVLPSENGGWRLTNGNGMTITAPQFNTGISNVNKSFLKDGTWQISLYCNSNTPSNKFITLGIWFDIVYELGSQ